MCRCSEKLTITYFCIVDYDYSHTKELQVKCDYKRDMTISGVTKNSWLEISC